MGRRRACVRTGDGVDELAVDEELGEPDLHLGHLERPLAAPVRSRHAAARATRRALGSRGKEEVVVMDRWMARPTGRRRI